MTAELGPQAAPGGWQQALDDLERGLQEAARAAAALRRSLDAGEPAQPESESEAARATAALRRSLASREAEQPENESEAARAAAALRRSLDAGEPRQPESESEAARATAALRRSLGVREPAQSASDPKVRELPLPLRPRPEEASFEPPAQEPPATPDGSAAFERVWARLEAEKLGKVGGALAKAGEDAAAKVTSKLSSLPGQFIITVEDRESKVDLVPLHRALAGLPGVEEVSLVSFANGVPVISLRVAGDLDHGRLSRAVAMATDRECEVIPHENGKLFLRLTPRGDEAS